MMEESQIVPILLYTYQEEEIFQYDDETGEPALDKDGKKIKLLTAKQELEAVKKYYIEKAIHGFEANYRVQLGGLGDERDHRAAALLVGSWLSKGPAAVAYVDGTADALERRIIEAEAAARSLFSKKKTAPMDLAKAIAERYTQYRIIDPYLTGLRAGATQAVVEATSVKGVLNAFEKAASAAAKAVEGLARGEDVSALLGL